MATHMQIDEYEKQQGVIILQFYNKLQNTVLLVELVSFMLDNIYNTVLTHFITCLMNSNSLRNLLGTVLKSVDYSGKQRLRRV